MGFRAGLGFSGMAGIGTVLVQLAQVMLYARFLDAHDFGFISLVTAIQNGCFVFSDLGLTNAVVSRQVTANRELASFLGWMTLAGCGFGVVSMIAASIVAETMGVGALGAVVGLIGVNVITASPAQFFTALFQSRFRFGMIATAEVSSAVIGLGTGVAMVYSGFGIVGAVAGYSAQAVSRAIVLGVMARTVWSPSIRCDLATLRKHAFFGGYQVGDRGVQFLAAHMDRVIVGAIMGMRLLGVYYLANQICSRVINVLNPIINRVLFPFLVAVRHEKTDLGARYRRGLVLIGAVGAPIFVVIAAVPKSFSFVMLGHGWGEAVAVVQVLALLGILSAFVNPIGSLLLACDRVDWGFRLNVFAVIAAALGMAMGSAGWGLVGAAWGVLTAFCVVQVPVVLWIQARLAGISGREVLSFVWPFGVACCGSFLAVELGIWMVQVEAPVNRLALAVGLGEAAFYAFLYLAGRRLVREAFELLEA
jgi:O-antigen/teichoic acid export membrane protein